MQASRDVLAACSLRWLLYGLAAGAWWQAGRALLVLDCWLPAPCTREVESGLEIRARERAVAATLLDRDSRTWRLGDSCSRRSTAGQGVRDTPTGRARVATCQANWANILLAQDGVGCE
jgi:hypothetical protein